LIKNADFDTEPNNSLGTAQNLSSTSGVLGHVTSGSDADLYSISVLNGQRLQIDATLPGGGPRQFVNELATPSGSRLLLELVDPSGAVVASDSQSITHTASQAGTYVLRVSSTAAKGEYFVSYRFTTAIDGDFDDDGDYDCDDINALSTAIAQSGSVSLFDLNGDGILSILDQDAWRLEAGTANLGPERAYPIADANLDGVVNGLDFQAWDAHKFTFNTNWCEGNFDANQVIDGADFNLWNENRTIVLIGNVKSPAALAPPPAIVERAIQQMFHDEPEQAASQAVAQAWPGLPVRDRRTADPQYFQRPRQERHLSVLDRSLAEFKRGLLE
jgi:hypothetical protein